MYLAPLYCGVQRLEHTSTTVLKLLSPPEHCTLNRRLHRISSNSGVDEGETAPRDVPYHEPRTMFASPHNVLCAYRLLHRQHNKYP